MKKTTQNWIFQFILLSGLFTLTNSCKKDETPSSPKDPVITWANPADISYGTILNTTQLNASVDVLGTFVYTPSIGTLLNAGANQDLKVDFRPTDAANFNTASKTVKINVNAAPAIMDIDGNVYHSVIIGTQVWMVENLKTTKFKDGTSIPLLTNDTAWVVFTPGYCYYNGDATNKDTYGALYNWYAVNTDNLAPAGWRIPTDEDWTVLTSYLGGENFAGGKLKETGTTHWLSPNTQATNESGFTALPGGRQGNPLVIFNYIGDSGYWWSSSNYELYATDAWCRSINYLYSTIQRSAYGKQYEFSVRCVKN